jgi:hypothetical protein
MSKENEYTDIMRLKTTTQLFTILKNRTDYNIQAIEAVKSILEERDLSQEEIAAEVNYIDNLHEENVAKSEEPLEGIYKISNFIFPMGGLFQIASFNKADGYNQKAKDANKWAKRGCLFYLIVIILFALISMLPQ